MELPVFEIGATITAEERWHGLLWSAVPARVIKSTPSALVSYLPTGTVGTFATNRGLPETARWARVNLGWDSPTGAFLGWYVNFELPPTATSGVQQGSRARPVGRSGSDLALEGCG